MSDTIWVAIIGGLFASTPTLIATYYNNKKQTALSEYRLGEIEKKLDNALKDLNKISILETSIAMLDIEVKNIKKDIEEIKICKK